LTPGLALIASGSSSFDLLNKTGEPLVGRASSFYLYPFSQSEIQSRENLLETRQNLESRLVYGSYPEVVLMQSNTEREKYLKDIVQAYLLKDILVLDGIKNSVKMQKLLRLIALQIGQEVSLEKTGSELGLSKNTVEKYLDLLSKVFVIFRLGGFSRNLRKEVTKTGKWYFVDTGIRNALVNDFKPLALRSDTDRGGLWENYLISERRKHNNNNAIDAGLSFWRTYDGQEIDLVEDRGSAHPLAAFEFKYGAKSPAPPPAFTKAYPDARWMLVNRDNYLDFLFRKGYNR
jgi:predicted AAA+ superfamily ATPase